LLLFWYKTLYSTVRTSFLHTILMDVQHALNEDYVSSAVLLSSHLNDPPKNVCCNTLALTLHFTFSLQVKRMVTRSHLLGGNLRIILLSTSTRYWPYRFRRMVIKDVGASFLHLFPVLGCVDIRFYVSHFWERL
jgi:hypothetical protein